MPNSVSAGQSLLSQKKKKLLKHEGFVYRFARRGQNKSVWRCIKEKSLSCKGRLWELDSGERRVVQEHGHAPDPAEVKAREVINRIKDAQSKKGALRPNCWLLNFLWLLALFFDLPSR